MDIGFDEQAVEARAHQLLRAIDAAVTGELSLCDLLRLSGAFTDIGQLNQAKHQVRLNGVALGWLMQRRLVTIWTVDKWVREGEPVPQGALGDGASFGDFTVYSCPVLTRATHR